MKNRGFTLVELLGVIIILVVIFVLVFPSVSNILIESEETIYQKQINTILNAAYDWSLKNLNDLPDQGNKKYIVLGTLKKQGFVSSDINDPKKNKVFQDDVLISINNVGSNYINNSKYSKLSGNYLYTVELELMNTDLYLSKKPTITLNDIPVDKKGNYLTIISLNGTYTMPDFSALSHSKEDIKGLVDINITLNDRIVENIDTSKFGVYKATYFVVDKDGYSNYIVNNIIVGDLVPPTINFKEDNTISTSVTSYDLMKDVSCIDNSGLCDITYDKELEYGVAGKNIITYTAKDPSGNTITKKRVITIE